jgi:hypothetical protein
LRGRLRFLFSQLDTSKLFSNSLNGDGACFLDDAVLCADNELTIIYDDCHWQDGIKITGYVFALLTRLLTHTSD